MLHLNGAFRRQLDGIAVYRRAKRNPSFLHAT